MHRMIANYNLIPNMGELITPENLLIPELELTAHLIQQCSIESLFTKADFREFIVRICLRYGLLNPQETYFEQDCILSAELKDSGEVVFLDPKKLIRFIGLIAIEGRLHATPRKAFLNGLITGQKSSIWLEVFSAFKIHRWEDKQTSDGNVVISIKENTPEISEEHISKAEAFADFIVKDFEEDIFQSFKKKNRPIIKVLQQMEWEIGTIEFDIRDIPEDITKTFITAQRGHGYFDEIEFDADDTDEYDIEFSLLKLAWVVANGYTEYEYYNGIPANLVVDPRVAFDHDDYEGMMHDDFGGISLLQTYIDYGLESVVYNLQNISPRMEYANNNPQSE